jgi:hypothetical protein
MPNWSPPDLARITPHPEGVDGPFYVEDGCCTACGIPEGEAPEIFGWAQNDPNHCVVKHQPATADQVTRTLLAIAAGEMGCIRYRGTDPEIATRLVEMGEALLCDNAPPREARPALRRRVSFRGRGDFSSYTATDVAHLFDTFLRRRREGFGAYDLKPIRTLRSGDALVRFSWFKRQFHPVAFSMGQGAFTALIENSSASLSIARTVDDWLRSTDQFQDIRWFSDDQWATGAAGKETVV